MLCYREIGSCSVSCSYIVFTQEAKVAFGCASSNSYASLVLSKLPTSCFLGVNVLKSSVYNKTAYMQMLRPFNIIRHFFERPTPDNTDHVTFFEVII